MNGVNAELYGDWGAVIVRLLMAFLLGALVGLERERRDRPAGLRTHVLVSVGSALAMMISIVVAGNGNDPARLAAGVLTGIGFLGAGTIIRHGNSVRGLTTAASIWAAAAIGLAAGMGWYLGAIATSVLVFGALTVLRMVEGMVHTPTVRVAITAHLSPGVAFPRGLMELLAANGVDVIEFDVRPGEAGAPATVALVVDTSTHLSPRAVLALVQSEEGISTAEVTGPSRRSV